MAHELAMTNGRAAMAYFGETPWHRLGKKLDGPATAAVAMDEAGLNYDADLVPLYTVSGVFVPQRRAVVRSDNVDVLGVEWNPLGLEVGLN
jgi:hypothetical protein